MWFGLWNAEINPLFKTSDEKIIAVDCKMNV